MTKRPLLAISLAALAALALPTGATAQAWPSQPIRMVIPYPPGGANDITGRIYAQYLQKALGQTVVIENKAGAGGEIGSLSVVKAPADGYTLLFAAIGSLAIHAAIPTQRPAYELSKDLAGVSMGAGVALAIGVRGDLPAASYPAFVALAKSKPEGLTFGSAGNGSTQHLTGEYYRQRAGINLVHVPYKGSAPAISDLMGGQIDMVFETMPALSSQLTSGKIRMLAVTSAKRSPMLPQTPTLDELGLKGFEVTTLYGMLVPKATPKDIVNKLSAAMQSIGHMSEVQALLVKQGAEAVTSSPEETDAMIAREVAKWSEVAKTAKID